MEDTIRKISAIFDKMASVKITPTSNYAVHEYWMNRALKGDEKCKDTLFNWLSGLLRVDKSVLNTVFNAKYNKTNENKKMNKKLIRLTESDLHRIVKESVKKVIKEAGRRGKCEYFLYTPFDGVVSDFYSTYREVVNDYRRLKGNYDELEIWYLPIGADISQAEPLDAPIR